jgi:hypothetical protein
MYSQEEENYTYIHTCKHTPEVILLCFPIFFLLPFFSSSVKRCDTRSVFFHFSFKNTPHTLYWGKLQFSIFAFCNSRSCDKLITIEPIWWNKRSIYFLLLDKKASFLHLVNGCHIRDFRLLFFREKRVQRSKTTANYSA